MLVSGIATPPEANGFYSPTGAVKNGKPVYRLGVFEISVPTASPGRWWILRWVSEPVSNDLLFESPNNTATPDLVSGWIDWIGTGDPVLVAARSAPSAPGTVAPVAPGNAPVAPGSPLGTSPGNAPAAPGSVTPAAPPPPDRPDDFVRYVAQSASQEAQAVARRNIGAAALPRQDFGTIYRVAFIGDSITGASTGPLLYGSGYAQNGFAAHARYAARGMIEMVPNPVEPSFDFGIPGEVTSGFQPGGTSRATFQAALDSAADTVVYAMGANDCGSSSYSAATTKANMLSQWDEIEAAGKKLVILSVFPGAVNRQIYYLQNVLQLNHWIEWQAAIRGALYIDVSKVCDDNKDGVSDMDEMQDLIHPNARGASKIGYLVADRLTPHFSTANAFAFPAYDSTSWKTSNPYAHLGTVGSNQTATGWTVTPAGAGTTVVKNLIDRTDIPGVGNWQELVISGATDAGTLIAGPTHYTMLSISNSALAISAGDRFIGVCEIQPVTDSTFYGVSGFLFDYNNGSTSRRYDLEPNGAMAAMKAGKYAPIRYGILRTPELVFSSAVTHDLRMWVYFYGNGTIRIGRFGIIKL
jgi:lysophospholipase L1-like esterase